MEGKMDKLAKNGLLFDGHLIGIPFSSVNPYNEAVYHLMGI